MGFILEKIQGKLDLLKTKEEQISVAPILGVVGKTEWGEDLPCGSVASSAHWGAVSSLSIVGPCSGLTHFKTSH